MTAWEILAQIKGTLALVDGIATCAIGLEANITPSDYPLIRISAPPWGQVRGNASKRRASRMAQR